MNVQYHLIKMDEHSDIEKYLGKLDSVSGKLSYFLAHLVVYYFF